MNSRWAQQVVHCRVRSVKSHAQLLIGAPVEWVEEVIVVHPAPWLLKHIVVYLHTRCPSLGLSRTSKLAEIGRWWFCDLIVGRGVQVSSKAATVYKVLAWFYRGKTTAYHVISTRKHPSGTHGLQDSGMWSKRLQLKGLSQFSVNRIFLGELQLLATLLVTSTLNAPYDSMYMFDTGQVQYGVH